MSSENELPAAAWLRLEGSSDLGCTLEKFRGRVPGFFFKGTAMSHVFFGDSLTRAGGRWVIIFAASLPAGLAWAQATWTGATNQDWNTASNWSTSPANPSGNVTVNTATGNYPVVSANPTFTPVDIIVGGGGGTGQLDQTAGTLATGAGNWMSIGSAAGSEGAYNLGGSGSVSADRLLIGDTVGSGGAGVLTMNTSGTLTTTFSNSSQWWQDAGLVLGPGAGSPATLNLQGGTINSTNVWVGAWGSTGTWNQTGGTANVTGVFSVGNYEDVQGLTTGVATVQNGAVNATNVYVGRGRFTVDEISAVLTVSGGGAVNSENDLFVGYAGANNTGTLNINNGGTVSVGSTTERWMAIGRFDTANGQATIASGGTLNLNAGTDLRLGDSTTGTAGLDVNGGSLIGTGLRIRT